MSKKLVVRDPKTGERELLLVGTMAVGRDPRCDISDADPLLSRRHAEFVVTPQGVMVRDLHSRNGIQVNGVTVPEALLRPGDSVQVAHLTIKFQDDGQDRPAPVDHGVPQEDKTAMMQGAPPPHMSAPPPMASPAYASAPPPQYQQPQEEKTSLLPAARAQAPPSGARAAPSRVQAQPAARAAAAPAAASAGRRAARKAAGSWGARVLIHVVLLALVVFGLVAIPFNMWHSTQVEAIGAERANAVANWLAADTLRVIDAGAGASAAVDGVANQPGVRSALVFTPDGKIISPGSRASETVAQVPAIGGTGKEPSAILRSELAWNGDAAEVVRIVGVKDNPRAAIAWVTFNPSTSADGGTSLVVLGPTLLIALGLAFAVATVLSRGASKALTVFNEDIELALAGQLESVADTFGAKPVRDLSDTVNYLVMRLRAGGAVDLRRGAGGGGGSAVMQAPVAEPRRGASGPSYQAPPQSRPQASYAPAPQAQPHQQSYQQPSGATREARLVANAKYQVTEASPECQDLLGPRPDAMVGRHLLDAIPDKQIVDGVLKCLSELPASGDTQTVVSPEGRPYKMAVMLKRSGKDQPITITLRITDAS